MIETERLQLRPPEPADAPAVYRIVSDPEVMRWLAGEPGDMDAAVARIERGSRAWGLDGFGPFAVVRRDTSAMIGTVGLLCWDPDDWHNSTRAQIGDDAEIELGWTLERATWGHGFATEAALAVRDWTLAEVAPRRLISLIHPDNARSMRVAEKIGETYRHDVTLQRGLTVGLWQLASPA